MPNSAGALNYVFTHMTVAARGVHEKFRVAVILCSENRCIGY